MDGRAGRVVMACFIGAFLGTAVALKIGQIFWWVGLLVGGFAGYLSYEFKKVVEAVPRAWQAVTSLQGPNWREVIALAMIFGSMAFVLVSIASPLSVFIFGAGSSFLGFIACLLFCWGIVCVMLAEKIFSASIVKKAFGPIDVGRIANCPAGDLSQPGMLLTFLAGTNPIALYVYLPLIGLVWLLPRIPRVFVTIGRFFVKLFRLIHSDIRLLCGVDAAIGVVFGYFFGSPLVGGIFGAVIGLVNFELVSKRWLKLVPVRS